MPDRSDGSLLVLPTLAFAALLLLWAGWDVVAPFLGLTGPRTDQGDQLLLTLVVLAGASVVYRIALVLGRRRIGEPEDVYTYRKLLGLGVVVGTAGVVVAIWIRALETIALSLGLVGAGLMLALGPVITGVAGWMHLVVTKPYRVGDRVEVGDIRGDVVDIRLLHTVLLEVGDNGPTGSIVQVPNSRVLDGSVVNDTKDFDFRWMTVQLPVSYESDWRTARDLFRSILVDEAGPATVEAKEIIRELRGKYYLKKRDISPVVTISFDSNWILLSGRFVAPTDDAVAVRNRVHEAVIEAVEEHPEIEIGAESLDVTVRGDSDPATP